MYYLYIKELGSMLSKYHPFVSKFPFFNKMIAISSVMYENFTTFCSLSSFDEDFLNATDRIPFPLELSLAEKKDNTIIATLEDLGIFDKNGNVLKQYEDNPLQDTLPYPISDLPVVSDSDKN